MFHAIASASFLTSDEGGLIIPVATPCRSFLVQVTGAEGHDQVLLGANIDTDEARDLGPGEEFSRLVLEFWADVAPMHVRPGEAFALCCPSRVVARGVFLEVEQ